MNRSKDCRARVTAAVAGLAVLVGVSGAGLAVGVVTASQAGAATGTPVAAEPTPVMGWNSWNHFGCALTEGDIRAAADQIVASGLDKLGYNYVSVDDCWMTRPRDSSGNLKADPTSLPSGIKALADYVHGEHLKFGIYESAGSDQRDDCRHPQPHPVLPVVGHPVLLRQCERIAGPAGECQPVRSTQRCVPPSVPSGRAVRQQEVEGAVPVDERGGVGAAAVEVRRSQRLLAAVVAGGAEEVGADGGE